MRDRPGRLSLTRARERLARDGREIADPVVAALSHQREECALRVRALQDPPAAQDFDWPVDDFSRRRPSPAVLLRRCRRH